MGPTFAVGVSVDLEPLGGVCLATGVDDVLHVLNMREGLHRFTLV